MSKLRSAFGIDDILYQNGASSSSSSTSKSPSRLISDKACDYAASVSSSMPIPSDIYMNTAHQPKKPYAQFPPAMNFAKSNFYMPDLASAFSSTAYLEQYANALKVPPRLWPFYPHPYGGYYLPPCNLKRKGGQVRFTPQQTTSLERRFANHKYLSPEDRKHLAMQLKLSDRQVKTWFQNRRAKYRRSNAGVTTSESTHHSNHTPSLLPLNLQKNYPDEKHLNVSTTSDEDSSSDDDGELQINLSDNKT